MKNGNPGYDMPMRKCVWTMISAVTVFVCVCIGVTMNLTTIYDVNFDHMGLRTFCMFTVNSNILCGLGMMITVPYTIDGLRKKDFNLPSWVIDLLFCGVTSVGLTFLVSLCILAPVKGFVLIFTGSRFFLHGLCPILAITAFCFFMTGHVIRIKEALISMSPVIVYAMVYYFMVEILGPDNGGWDDFYGFFTKIPAWVSLLSFIPITFAIATALRLLHNGSVRREERKEAEFYSREFSGKDAHGIIVAIAEKRRTAKHTYVSVPAGLLETVVRETGSDMTINEACTLYTDTILEGSAQEENGRK